VSAIGSQGGRPVVLRNDPVRAYFRSQGYAAHVVARGLEGLLDSWERTVRELESQDFEFMWEEYLNDMDGRRILQEGFGLAPTKQQRALKGRLQSLDARFMRATAQVDECIWGNDRALKRGWDPATDWWYFRLPSRYSDLRPFSSC
jgi:hypothetical protein